MAKIAEKSGVESEGVSREVFDTTVASLDKNNKNILILMTGVIIVLFIGFVTILAQMYLMVIDSNNLKTSAETQMTVTMMNLTNTLNQNVKK